MQKWEYMTLEVKGITVQTINGKNIKELSKSGLKEALTLAVSPTTMKNGLSDVLNPLGDAGWEIVSNINPTNEGFIVIILKRPR